MKAMEFFNGVSHLVTSAGYALLCVQHHVIDAHALMAFGTAGIGVCLIAGCLKGARRQDREA